MYRRTLLAEMHMFRRITQRWLSVAGLVALAGVLLGAGSARSEELVINNNTEMTIVVNVSTVVAGKVVRERPQMVAPGKAALFELPAGNHVLDISDSKRPRQLFSGAIPASRLGQTYSLTGEGKLEKK
jgi:hypothetical protein